MKQVIVNAFGGVDQLEVVETPTPDPGPGQIRIAVTSIGMNHAELMGRRGEYRLSTGDPPFTPGLEAGGVIDAVGEGVKKWKVGDRAVLGVDVPRLGGMSQPGSTLAGAEGGYRSHYVCDASDALPAPAALPDQHLGALWLAYLTAWGCLVWKTGLDRQAGSVIALPAASSSVALAASQIVKRLSRDNLVIGLTTSEDKKQRLEALDAAMYDHVIVTRDESGEDRKWHRDIKTVTDGRGVDVFFDPVAAGKYLDTEIKCLAQFGTVWVYGLLGSPGVVDVTPLIRKHASVRGWALSELTAAGRDAFLPGCNHILEGFAKGDYTLHVDQTFALDDVRKAHEVMEQGRHVGKLVLIP